MEICNKITLPIIYYIYSRLVNRLKGTDAPIQVSDSLDLTVIFMFIVLALRSSFFSFLKCLLASRLTLFRLSILFLFGSRNH
jgi:hypothetical protein